MAPPARLFYLLFGLRWLGITSSGGLLAPTLARVLAAHRT